MTVIRSARDSDSSGLIQLIGDVFAEYPGCILDVPREEPDLLRVASAFSDKGGHFWVAESEGRIVGCVGWAPLGRDAAELKKLYVCKDARRQGLGTRLSRLVEYAARGVDRRAVMLWSDTRFTTAHEFYRRYGYVETGRTRELGDLSQTVERDFLLNL